MIQRSWVCILPDFLHVSSFLDAARTSVKLKGYHAAKGSFSMESGSTACEIDPEQNNTILQLLSSRTVLGLFKKPNRAIASSKQDTWLTRQDPRPQIESSLYQVPEKWVEQICAGLAPVSSATLCLLY